MKLTIKQLPFGERPEITPPNPEILQAIGEERVRQLVSDHYDRLAQSPIKYLFPPKGIGLELAKKHSANFFIQRLGGPDYFNQTRGKPMLASRHGHFKITPTARMEWLKIYQELLPELGLPDHLLKSYWDYLHDFSNWMVNTPEDMGNSFKMG